MTDRIVRNVSAATPREARVITGQFEVDRFAAITPISAQTIAAG